MKFVLGFILFIYVFVSTPLIELAKIPELYTHFLEHAESNKNLSFYDFLYLHYGCDSEHSESHHGSLPFKSTNQNTVLTIELPANIWTIKLPIYCKEFYSTVIYFYQSQYVFQYLDAIWQPPR
jgi:hypothetical protein